MKRLGYLFVMLGIFASLCLFISADMFEYSIEAGQTEEVTVTGEGVLVEFTPIVGGEYWFESISGYDTSCEILDSAKTYLYENDDSGDAQNFRLKYTLTEGETYYYHVMIPKDSSHLSLTFQVKLQLHTPAASHVHEWVEEVIKEPTCTESGTMQKSCYCTMVESNIEISATGHKGESVTVEPTCTQSGSVTTVCTVCGQTEVKTLEALGHEYKAEFVVDIAPTCTAKGEESFHCIRCGLSDSKTSRDIEALGHSYGDWYVLKAPTCTATGKDQRVCSVCQSTETIDTPATGHNYSTKYTIDKAATCTTEGSKSIHCTLCDEIKPGSSVTIAVKGHNYSSKYTVDKAATCTEKGSKSRHCTVCGAKTDTVSISAKGHTLTKVTVIKKATCTEKGSRKGTCSVCGTKVTESTAKLGHNYSTKYTVDKKATCTTKGSKSKHCTRCDAKTSVTSIPAKGHSYSTKYTVDKKATTTSAGSKSKHCSRCDATTGKVSIPKISKLALSKEVYQYNGNAKKPTVTVTDSAGKSITSFTAAYDKNCKTIGKHKVTVKFSGKYSGTVTLKYKIVPDDVSGLKFRASGADVTLSWSAVKGATAYKVYTYNSSTSSWEVFGKCSGTSYTAKLSHGRQYKLAVRAMANSTLSSNYTSIQVVTAPVSTTLKASAGTKRATLSWTAVECSGYELYVSTSRNGGYSLAKRITPSSCTSFDKTSLQSGTTYYFRLRPYTKVGDIYVYSAYSNIVVVKVK